MSCVLGLDSKVCRVVSVVSVMYMYMYETSKGPNEHNFLTALHPFTLHPSPLPGFEGGWKKNKERRILKEKKERRQLNPVPHLIPKPSPPPAFFFKKKPIDIPPASYAFFCLALRINVFLVLA